MKDLNKKIQIGIVMATLITVFPASSVVFAQTQCKGLENPTCNQNSLCSWVDSYERKDGVKVNGFCRTKPKSKSTTTTTPPVNKQS